MERTSLAISALRVLLVVAFILLMVFQIMSMPGEFAQMAREEPEMAYLRWPLTAFAALELACVQVIIVSTWQLLSLVRRDRIFSEASLKWVDVIILAIGAAGAMLVGLILYFLLSRGRPDDPGAPMVLFLLLVGGTVVELLMVVMRALLRQATMLRTEMEAVI